MEAKRDALPRHVAVIMDGNGRWAEARGMRRVKGHENGIDSVRAIAEECARLGVSDTQQINIAANPASVYFPDSRIRSC